MLIGTDWDTLLDEDIDVSWTNWHGKFMEIMEQCVPKRNLTCRKNLPWLNKKLVTSMKKTNLLYRSAKKSGDYTKYKGARNKLVSDKGLFRYNRLPFGVASAPSIFQWTMDNLQGIPGGCVYIDDILITGTDN